MQDSIYHMTLKWHFVGNFAVKIKYDFPPFVCKRDVIKDITA